MALEASEGLRFGRKGGIKVVVIGSYDLVVDAVDGDINFLQDGSVSDEGHIIGQKLEVEHEEVEDEDENYLGPDSAFSIRRLFQVVQKGVGSFQLFRRRQF